MYGLTDLQWKAYMRALIRELEYALEVTPGNQVLQKMIAGLRKDLDMPDYKAMYYHLAGRMATAVEVLEATTDALADISEKLKQAQQTTEDMFIESGDDDPEGDPE